MFPKVFHGIFLKLIFLSLTFAAYTAVEDYCNVDDENVVCKRAKQQCKPDYKKCGEVIKYGLQPKERIFIQERHNVFRNIIGLKQHPEVEHSQGANLRYMNYCMELEYSAQCHANACTFHKDQKLGSPLFAKHGQNLHVIRAPWNNITKAIEEITYAWIHEIAYNELNTTEYRDMGNNRGTQMLWALSHIVGCGFIQYKNNSIDFVYLVCNYYVAGNIDGEHIFQNGKECTKCMKKNECDIVYKGLCAEPRTSVYDPNFEGPFKLTGDAKHLVTNLALFCFVVIAVLLLKFIKDYKI